MREKSFTFAAICHTPLPLGVSRVTSKTPLSLNNDVLSTALAIGVFSGTTLTSMVVLPSSARLKLSLFTFTS